MYLITFTGHAPFAVTADDIIEAHVTAGLLAAALDTAETVTWTVEDLAEIGAAADAAWDEYLTAISFSA